MGSPLTCLTIGYKIDISSGFRMTLNPRILIMIIRKRLCLYIGNQCGQGFSLAFGRLLQFAILQERCDTVYQEPSVSVEYKLQFICFDLSKMCRNRFQYSFSIRCLQRLKLSLILCLDSLVYTCILNQWQNLPSSMNLVKIVYR